MAEKTPIIEQLLDATGAVAKTGEWFMLHGRKAVGVGGTVVGTPMAGSLTLEVDVGDGVARPLMVSTGPFAFTISSAGQLSDAFWPVPFKRIRAKWAPTGGNSATGTVVLWGMFS